jgi:calcineurin-like phosphoesterase family protein
MKILVLSDLDWNKESKEISDIDIAEFPIKKDFSSSEHRVYFRSLKFRSFWRYRSIIEEAKPNIVLLAGDITGDGYCGHGFHKALFLLFCYLESIKTTTFFIIGNHDYPQKRGQPIFKATNPNFKYILEKIKGLKYIKYIAGQVVDYEGIKILGLDYQDTYNKTTLQDLISKNHSLDIVLAHCHSHRRIWLFDFDTDYVITGHWDQNIGLIENKAFISMVNDTPEDINYCTIEFNKNHEVITYYNFNSIINKIQTYKAIRKGKTFNYKPNSSELTNTEFCDAVGLMRKTKRIGVLKISQVEREQLESIIWKFSKVFFTDYLGVTLLDNSQGYRWSRKLKDAN